MYVSTKIVKEMRNPWLGDPAVIRMSQWLLLNSGCKQKAQLCVKIKTIFYAHNNTHTFLLHLCHSYTSMLAFLLFMMIVYRVSKDMTMNAVKGARIETK